MSSDQKVPLLIKLRFEINQFFLSMTLYTSSIEQLIESSPR